MSPERLAAIGARLDSVPTCPLYRAKNGGKAHPKGTQVWMNDRGDGRFVADTNCLHGDYAAVFANAVVDLTDLLAEVRHLRARLRDTCQRLVEAVGADGPCDAEQAADRVVVRLAETERDREKLIRKIDCVARERDDLGRLTDRLRDRLVTLDRERNRALAQLSAYTDLPPEPDTALGAFMAVLEVDNDPETPDNYAGDCDGESR